MKIAFNEQSFKFATDNSNECDKETAFIKTSQNEKYLQNALTNHTCCVIDIKEISNLFGLKKIKIIGITGTNGKTTTASAMYSILLDLDYKVAMQGTRGFFINDEMIGQKNLTTPSVLQIYKNIYQAVTRKCEYFIMEVSSHAISQHRIEGIDFELKILTNITRDHLDFHKTLDNYISTKNSFFQDEGKKLINKDEKHASFNPKHCYTYGIENPATYRLIAYSLNSGLSAIIQNFEKTVSFESSLQGFFNFYNLLAAIAGVDLITSDNLEDIVQKVDNFAGVSGRMEQVCNKPNIIIDFAHTPDGIAQVLNALKEKELIVVFGAGGDRDKTKRPIMGRIVASLAKKIYITSDNPRFEDPQAIIDNILDGIKDKRNIIVDINRKQAIRAALKEQKDDEVVLILGKGDENYQIVYDKKLPFNDKEIVQEYLDIIP